MTIVYTTHYMEEAERLCDRVAIVDEGRLLALDSPAGLIGLLGGGVVQLGLEPETARSLLAEVRAIPGVLAVTAAGTASGAAPDPGAGPPADGHLKLATADPRRVLLDLIQLCNEKDARILSLEVLEPNLENVFLHLTGKRLRD
jgi:ABC-2 type transport system ATP-binding protein